MYNGIINVYKEKGFTSFDVVAKLRGILHQKKIGHTGTLDPDAEGVLPVCLGKATKVCELLTDRDKEYETVLLLGQSTDTQDVTGAVTATAEVNVPEETVRKTIDEFVGEIMQIPPMYSALKVDGRKLCDLAREGITVERKPRRIEIFEIVILGIDLPRVRMRVHCSKGTYIRTLCHDIGERLGCHGCMGSLVRTRAAGFTLADAHRLGEIEELLASKAGEKVFVDDILIKVDNLFSQYPAVRVSMDADKLVRNGNRIPERLVQLTEREDSSAHSVDKDTVRLYDSDDRFIGLYAYCPGERDYKPIKLFMES